MKPRQSGIKNTIIIMDSLIWNFENKLMDGVNWISYIYIKIVFWEKYWWNISFELYFKKYTFNVCSLPY